MGSLRKNSMTGNCRKQAKNKCQTSLSFPSQPMLLTPRKCYYSFLLILKTDLRDGKEEDHAYGTVAENLLSRTRPWVHQNKMGGKHSLTSQFLLEQKPCQNFACILPPSLTNIKSHSIFSGASLMGKKKIQRSGIVSQKYLCPWPLGCCGFPQHSLGLNTQPLASLRSRSPSPLRSQHPVAVRQKPASPGSPGSLVTEGHA